MESHGDKDPVLEIENDNSNAESPRGGHPIKKQKNSPNADTGMVVPPSPPTFVTMGQLAEAANAFYNMSLAHEITVDSDFKIEKYEPPEESLENCIKKTMHRAFWDLLRSSLESDPPDYEPALRLLSEVKQSLNGLVLPKQKTLQKLIDNSLDLEVARLQLKETGRLSLEAYAEQVISLMKQFCAPVRDKEVESLRLISDPVDAFQHAFTLLEKMHMDLANFTIAQMRPYIRQQAATYERSKFAAFLETQQAVGVDGLAHTRDWIHEAYQQLTRCELSPGDQNRTSMDNTPSTSASIPTGREEDRSTSLINPTPNNILREAYLALLTWPTTKDWPETMVMDRQRIKDLGVQLSRIVKLSSLVLVVCNYVATNSARIFPNTSQLSPDPNTMSELKRAVCRSALAVMADLEQTGSADDDPDAADPIVLAVEHWCNRIMNSSDVPKTISVSPSDNQSCTSFIFPRVISETLKSQIDEVLHVKHPVCNVMHKRAIEFLRLALSSHPPEPLPLPAGFGVLCDVTFESSNPGNTRPIVMATGGHLLPNRHLISTTEENTANNDSSPNLSTLSLSYMASRLLPLLAHNRHVFGPWYAEIIQALLIPPETSKSADDVPTAATQPKSTDDETTFEMNA